MYLSKLEEINKVSSNLDTSVLFLIGASLYAYNMFEEDHS